MKKIIYILPILLLMFSCSEDKVLIPESLLVEETDLTFVAEGETYLNRFYSTEGTVSLEVPEDVKGWLAVTIENKNLKIVTQPNSSISPRSAIVGIKAIQRSASLKISQSGQPTKKLTITGGSYSSSQANEGSFINTYDGNLETYWHSEYSPNSQQNLDHWLLYNLADGTESLDLITIYSRFAQGGANGRWGYFSVWVKGDGTDVPSTIEDTSGIDWGGELGSVDADGFKLLFKGDETPYRNVKGSQNTSILLPESVANPKSVKFVIKGAAPNGSVGGHGSFADVELFGKVN